MSRLQHDLAISQMETQKGDLLMDWSGGKIQEMTRERTDRDRSRQWRMEILTTAGSKCERPLILALACGSVCVYETKSRTKAYVCVCPDVAACYSTCMYTCRFVHAIIVQYILFKWLRVCCVPAHSSRVNMYSGKCNKHTVCIDNVLHAIVYTEVRMVQLLAMVRLQHETKRYSLNSTQCIRCSHAHCSVCSVLQTQNDSYLDKC